MNKADKLDLIKETGVIAILRAKSSDQLIKAAEAIWNGGVKVLEVTLTTPGALELVAAAQKKYGEKILFGAGSVLDAETARLAILAGADFIVTPTLNLQTIQMGHRYNIPIFPGCFTPTEMVAACEAGVDMIKFFPAEIGGAKAVKAILAPLPHLQIIPVGGVDLTTAADFIRNGAVALGVGSSLVTQNLLDSGDMAELTRRAAAFIEAVRNGRASQRV